MARESYILNFVGDVMLGRLIDQAFPTHVYEPDEARIVESFKRSRPHLMSYDARSPWGSALPLFEEADLNLINLETSVTDSARKWPDKVFNYRMHPDNIKALLPANVTYASLANNHTLDFSEQGLHDTVTALEGVNVAYAGAGRTREEATAPAILTLGAQQHVYVWSAADHPEDWSGVPGFLLIDYSQQTKSRLKQLIEASSIKDSSRPPSLKVFSVHWGPNYSWRPADEIRDLAHFLIDDCGIDIIHGHSSHHVQGVERYRGKLIIYGCGDFVDDYALVASHRNDLSAVWRVNLGQFEDRVKPVSLEVFPTKIVHFQAMRLGVDDPDHAWTCHKLRMLSADLGSSFQPQLGNKHQLILDL